MIINLEKLFHLEKVILSFKLFLFASLDHKQSMNQCCRKGQYYTCIQDIIP